MELLDFGAIARSGMAQVPDYAQQAAMKQQMALQQQEQQRLQQQQYMEQAKAQQEQNEELSYQNDLAQYLKTNDPQDLIRLAAKYPQKSEGLKRAFDAQDKVVKDADLRQAVSILSYVNNGRPELAAAALQDRIEKGRAAGEEDDPQDAAILDALKSGDPERVKEAKGMMTYVVSAITGTDNFSKTYGDLNPKNKQSSWLTEYNDRVETQGKTAADQWDSMERVKIGPPGGVVLTPENMASFTGGQPVMEGGAPASSDAVSSVLQSSGMSPAVVAGFLANFHHESAMGQNKNPGDGGTAFGLAQWRNERVNNFQRIIGKHPQNATISEQAKFVGWEMQNPVAAGMTVAQRDKILAAKTPEQAAALIDKFYERSDGKTRGERIKSARKFFNPGDEPVKVKSVQQARALPPGTVFLTPDGQRKVR